MTQTIKNTFNWITLNSRKAEKDLIFQVLEYLLILKKDQSLSEIFKDFKLKYLVDINLAYYIQISPHIDQSNAVYITDAIRVLIHFYKENKMEKRKRIEFLNDNGKDNNKKSQKNLSIERIKLNALKDGKIYKDKNNFEESKLNYFKDKINVEKLKNELAYDDIKFEYTIVKNYLQLAASNSQLDKNLKSIKCGKRAVYYFSKMMTNLNCIFQDCKKKNDQKNLILKSNSELKNNFHEFFNLIIKMNNLVLSSLKYLEDDNFNLHDFFLEIHEIEKLLKKKSFNSPWMKNISISNFMHVEYFTYTKISHMITFNEIFTEGFLSLNLMLISTIYFMLATENRLICFKENDINGKNNFKIKPVFEKTHFEKIKKTKKFIFSEKLHNFAVKLLKNYFEPNILINHFIRSYSENYEKKFDLDQILEEDSIYNKSFMNTYRNSCVEYSFDNNLMDYSKILIDDNSGIIFNEKILKLENTKDNEKMMILKTKDNLKLGSNFDNLCKNLKKLPEKILNPKNLKKMNKTNGKNNYFVKKNFLKKDVKKSKKNFIKNLKLNFSTNKSLNRNRKILQRNISIYQINPHRNSKKKNFIRNNSSLKSNNSLQNLKKKKINLKTKMMKKFESTHKKNFNSKKGILSKKSKFDLENPNFESSKTLKKLSVSKESSKNQKKLSKLITNKATKRTSTKNKSFSRKKISEKKKKQSHRLNKMISCQNFTTLKDLKVEKLNLNFLKQKIFQ